MAISAGIKFGSYEVVAQIGAWGMGEVYGARNFRLDRIVAIKALPAHFADHFGQLQRKKKYPSMPPHRFTKHDECPPTRGALLCHSEVMRYNSGCTISPKRHRLGLYLTGK